VKAFLFALLVTAAATASGAAAELKLDIRDGKVTLDARDVTVRQIMTEWARVGQTRVINLERVGSTPVTLQLSAVPERQALDIVLRSLAGYLAAPRTAGTKGASAYDRILILAASSVASAARPQAPATSGRTPGSGVQPRPAMPGPGAPDLILPDPTDLDDDPGEQDSPPGRQPPARPGGAMFGMPPAGTTSQPGMFAQPPGATDQPDPATASLQAPTASPSPATPYNVPGGTVTPGIVPVSPGPQGTQAPPGTRPPTPDR
jgi:hypothetical protein